MPKFSYLYDSPIGQIQLKATETQLLEVSFLSEEKPEMSEFSSSIIKKTVAFLDDYFSGKEPKDLDFLFEGSGTPFQKKVWRAVSAVAWGETVTYGELAKRVSCGSAQAVGQALGKNPFLILIPCHRVLGQNGSLCGYAGGLERKAWLLAHEEKRKGNAC